MPSSYLPSPEVALAVNAPGLTPPSDVVANPHPSPAWTPVPSATPPLPGADANREAAARLAALYREHARRVAKERVAEAVTAYRQALALVPTCTQTPLDLAECVLRQGQFGEAALLYEYGMALAPVEAVTHLHYAEVLYRSGRHEESIEFYRQAVSLMPQSAEAFCGLGMALQEVGSVEEAAQACRTAISLKPTYMWSHFHLGMALRGLNQLEASKEAFWDALRLEPKVALIHTQCGVTFRAQGKPDWAEAASRTAIELEPTLAIAHYHLGCALRAQGKLDDAALALAKAVELDPRNIEALLERGYVLHDQRKFNDAADVHRAVIRLDPAHALALRQLGICLYETGRRHEACDTFEQALRLKPDCTLTLVYYGLSLNWGSRNTEAIEAARRSVRLDPNFAWGYNVMGISFQANSEIDSAVEAYREALRCDRGYVVAHDNLLYCQLFQPQLTLKQIKEAAQEWGRSHADPYKSQWGNWNNTRDPHRPLVVGFVSPDFRRHPVGEFLIGSFEELSREPGWRTICYYNVGIDENDPVTKRFRAAAHAFHEVQSLSDDALAAKIREDRVDILFEMTAHTWGNRLLLFARKPAPIQISWIGVNSTIGMEAIDYLISDRHQIPPECESGYVERIIRMPDVFNSYSPPGYAPEVATAPFQRNGYVTFGCFNGAAKIRREMIATWSTVLKRVPRSKMLFRSKEFNDAGIRERYLRLWRECGIEAECIEFVPGRGDHREYLEAYGTIDIQLDTFPYNGATTTVESLRMGVPVVTLVGEGVQSRYSYTFLSVLGLPELAAQSVDEYVEKAVALATDAPRLAALREGLRPRMQQSALCDHKRFVAGFTRELRRAWGEWCASGG